MKVLYFIFLFLEMVCFLMKQLFCYLFRLFSSIWEKLNKLRRVIFCKYCEQLKQKEVRQRKNDRHEKVILQHITMQINTESIVGKTKTEFLKESDLPRFRKAEIIQSVPLEKETVNDFEEEEDLDSSNVEVTLENDDELRRMLEEENEDPDLYDNLPPTDDLSMATGVNLDELEKTFNTLKKEDYTKEEKEKVKLVFEKIEGTDFLLFFLMQNESMEKAKLFMQEIEANNQPDSLVDSEFNINKYI